MWSSPTELFGYLTPRGVSLGVLVFICVSVLPLVIMWGTLHRLPQRWRLVVDGTIALSFCTLALCHGFQVGNLSGRAFLFAVVALGASIDLLHVGRRSRLVAAPLTLLSVALVAAHAGHSFALNILYADYLSTHGPLFSVPKP